MCKIIYWHLHNISGGKMQKKNPGTLLTATSPIMKQNLITINNSNKFRKPSNSGNSALQLAVASEPTNIHKLYDTNIQTSIEKRRKLKTLNVHNYHIPAQKEGPPPTSVTSQEQNKISTAIVTFPLTVQVPD